MSFSEQAKHRPGLGRPEKPRSYWDRLWQRVQNRDQALQLSAASPESVPSLRIFESELQAICQHAIARSDTETGGFLHGSYSGSGEPIVMLATPPGPKAIYRRGSFVQDYEYAQALDESLVDRYGLYIIGRWHSHHSVAPPLPSSEDLTSARSIMEQNDLPAFVEIIVHFKSPTHPVYLNPYVYLPH